jgi:hypothetical protein
MGLNLDIPDSPSRHKVAGGVADVPNHAERA